MPDDFVAGGDTGGSSGAAVVDSPSTGSETGSAPPGTTDQAASAPQPGPEGPVPYTRFKEINDKYSALRWAESFDAQQAQQQKAFFDWLDADPAGAFQYVETYLRRQGVLPQPQAPPPPADGGRPQPDLLVPETGQKVYSAEAAERLAKWQAETLLNERVGPIEQALQGYDQERVVTRSQAVAQAQLAEAVTWPHFEGNEQDILREMERDRRLSLEGAYRRVVFPKLRQLEREAIVAETKQKAAASTVNPGAISATDKKDVKHLSFTEVFRREYNKRRG